MCHDLTRHMVIEKDIVKGMNYENTLRNCRATAVQLPATCHEKANAYGVAMTSWWMNPP